MSRGARPHEVAAERHRKANPLAHIGKVLAKLLKLERNAEASRSKVHPTRTRRFSANTSLREASARGELHTLADWEARDDVAPPSKIDACERLLDEAAAALDKRKRERATSQPPLGAPPPPTAIQSGPCCIALDVKRVKAAVRYEWRIVNNAEWRDASQEPALLLNGVPPGTRLQFTVQCVGADGRRGAASKPSPPLTMPAPPPVTTLPLSIYGSGPTSEDDDGASSLSAMLRDDAEGVWCVDVASCELFCALLPPPPPPPPFNRRTKLIWKKEFASFTVQLPPGAEIHDIELNTLDIGGARFLTEARVEEAWLELEGDGVVLAPETAASIATALDLPPTAHHSPSLASLASELEGERVWRALLPQEWRSFGRKQGALASLRASYTPERVFVERYAERGVASACAAANGTWREKPLTPLLRVSVRHHCEWAEKAGIVIFRVHGTVDKGRSGSERRGSLSVVEE